MYSSIFVAGTFDKLHFGHEALLNTAFREGEQVTIGLTSDTFVAKYKSGGPYGTYNEREKALVSWLKERKLLERSAIQPIDNPFEPASTGAYSALIVTPVNRHRGEEINAIRAGLGLTPLSLVEVPIINAEDGLPISSTRIRNGEIDSKGHLFLPETMRPGLQEPFGKVLAKEEIPGAVNAAAGFITVSVGDQTTANILKLGLVPSLSVIDLKVRRQPFQDFSEYRFPATAEVVKIASGPGFISGDAIAAVKKWAAEVVPGKNTVILVEGEEDLITLPAILYAPIGSIVFYGQPELPDFISKIIPTVSGLVEVVVTQKVKERVLEIMAKFTKN